MRLLTCCIEEEDVILTQTCNQNVQPKLNHAETSDELRLQGRLESIWVVLSKNFKDKKSKHLSQLTRD